MRKPVWMRVKVEDELRSRFKEAAWRSHHHPSQVLRLLMEKYVEAERDRFAVDLTVWSNIRTVAEEVVQHRNYDRHSSYASIGR
jgi:hypothetical protein